jgi:hypothetical protein
VSLSLAWSTQERPCLKNKSKANKQDLISGNHILSSLKVEELVTSSFSLPAR